MRQPPRARGALLGLVAFAVALTACGEPVVPGGGSPVCAAETHVEPTHGAPVGVELLHAIAKAERETAFSGYRTTTFGEQGSRATRMRIARYPSGQTVLEWDGAGGDEGADGDRKPPKRWVYETRYRWLESPELLASNYSIEFECGETPAVAFRPTCRVRVESRREGRPSLELLVDAGTWLILRETWRDHAGSVRRVSAFDTLEYGPPAGAEAPQDGEALRAPECGEGSAMELSFAPLVVDYVPEGFERIGQRMTSAGALREYWSDGLAAFALIQRPSEDADASPEGELSRRSCDVGTRFTGTLLQHSVTVVGSLPAAELERVVRGLRAPAQ